MRVKRNSVVPMLDSVNSDSLQQRSRSPSLSQAPDSPTLSSDNSAPAQSMASLVMAMQPSPAAKAGSSMHHTHIRLPLSLTQPPTKSTGISASGGGARHAVGGADSLDAAKQPALRCYTMSLTPATRTTQG